MKKAFEVTDTECCSVYFNIMSKINCIIQYLIFTEKTVRTSRLLTILKDEFTKPFVKFISYMPCNKF